jgi:hypothetical protein
MKHSLILKNDVYDVALAVFENAVAAICKGDLETGDQLLSSLDTAAIEQDRTQLRELARTALPASKPSTPDRSSKTVSATTQRAVPLRDRYHCRFTGRRLIDVRVFHEISRLSNVFHFDEHHSVRDTVRGPAGHPMVRTHAAAYEHVDPHSRGGRSELSNIVHTSVQLNESKGAKILPQVPVPDDQWNGLTEYLDALRARESPALQKQRLSFANLSHKQRKPLAPRTASRPKGSAIEKVRDAASVLAVTVFAGGDDPEAEAAFSRIREAERNSFFATLTKDGSWMIHRLHCSSLTFNGNQKLTAHPKIVAADSRELRKWAAQFGVVTVICSRCKRPK